jgi:hypothetical protein
MEDALMHRFTNRIAAIALGAFAARSLPAQSPTDLADVCRVLGDAKLGQWATFDGTAGGSGGGKLRLAVVGSERSGDSTLYWFEVNFAGKDAMHSGVIQILTPSLASGLADPRALIIKAGAQPAMRISGQMAGMVGQKGAQNASAFDWGAKCSGARVVGWESVTVPAGTFRALHLTMDDGGEVWASRDVPFALVKTHGKQGDMVLTGRGTDAKSSITERPLEMPGMSMPKP